MAGGYSYRSVRPNGLVETELTADKMSVTFRTLNYDRWAKNWAEAKNYVERILPLYIQTAKFAAVGLTYSDKFVWRGSTQECNAAAILRSGSEYLCPRVFSANDLWHSHTGSFEKVDAHTKRLTTLNADLIEEQLAPDQARRALSITSVLTDMFNQPGFEPLQSSPGLGIDFVDRHMQELHRLDKVILTNILNPDMVNRIALAG